MDTAPFARFRSVIAAAPEAEIHDDVTLGGRLTLARDGRMEISYAPFEHIVPTAQVVIVGITPGARQAADALVEARRQVLSGADDATALAAAKVHGSFSGSIRKGLVGMLDHVGLHERLGIPTCDSLWSTDAHLAHFTSALRYPVFLDGENFNGNPVSRRPAILRECVETCLAEEVRALPEALWIPCGGKAAAGVQWLVRKGLLDPDKICLGMPHPSGSNVERVRYFLGTGRDRASLSKQTNPDLIDRAKEAMVARITRHTFCMEPSGPTPVTVAHPASHAPSSSIVKPKAAKPPKRPRREPSKLGREIHDAIAADPRFEEHREAKHYLCTYRTVGRSVFGFERVTTSAIILWLPAIPEVEKAARAEGIVVPDRSLPYPYPAEPERYGRLATLEQVPELEVAALYPIKVTSDRQALAVLAALP